MDPYDLAQGICDAHVHFGSCSLTDISWGARDLHAHEQRFRPGPSLVFPFDVSPLTTNIELLRYLRDRPESPYRVLLKAVPQGHESSAAIMELWRHSGRDRVRGFKFHTSLDKTRATDPAYAPWWEELDKVGGIALLHCGRWRDIAHFSFGIEAAKLYPDVKVILAHMGGNEVELTKGAIEAARGVPNVYLDTSNCRVGVMIKRAVRALGPGRVLFGSDAPWGSVMSNLWTLWEAGLDEDETRAVLIKSLRDLLDG